MKPTTTFSDCRSYRYVLYREWGGWFDDVEVNEACSGDRDYLNFICLNPSTADENKNDPTIRRCIGFARVFGFKAFAMTNLFAWRSKNPGILRCVIDPVGKDNLTHVLNVATGSKMVICAWGVRGVLMQQDAITVAALRSVGVKLNCLRITGTGFPEHPLYLPKELKPTPFNQFAIATA